VLSVGPVELTRVVEAAIEAVRPAAEAKNVRLQPVLDSHATIVGDADRLQQIAWNLLSNALKFTAKGGRVRVQLRRTHSYVELVLSDNGQGIEPEFLPFVFDRFRQARSFVHAPRGWARPGPRDRALARGAARRHGGRAQLGQGAGRGVSGAAAHGARARGSGRQAAARGGRRRSPRDVRLPRGAARPEQASPDAAM
jgi:signal transduction histidine kinase